MAFSAVLSGINVGVGVANLEGKFREKTCFMTLIVNSIFREKHLYLTSHMTHIYAKNLLYYFFSFHI